VVVAQRQNFAQLALPVRGEALAFLLLLLGVFRKSVSFARGG